MNNRQFLNTAVRRHVGRWVKLPQQQEPLAVDLSIEEARSKENTEVTAAAAAEAAGIQLCYNIHFYLATLCYSAVYAMVLCLSVCLSVYPSQVGVLLKWLNGLS